MSYDVIKERTVKGLITLANKKIKQGWKCQGGISTVVGKEKYSDNMEVFLPGHNQGGEYLDVFYIQAFINPNPQ